MLATLAVLALWGCAEDGDLLGACGDGIQDPGETCDDGNLEDGDGCDADCEIETDPGILPTLASIQTNIFTPFCAVCHTPGGTGPMPLNTEEASYESLVNFPFSFYCAVPRVDPGNPDGSCVVLKIEGSPQTSGTAMPPPPAPPLGQAQIDAIREWIEQGALP